MDGSGPTATPRTSLSVVEHLLVEQMGLVALDVEWVGEGAWSQCFGFEVDGTRRVIRLGRHIDDFEKDLRASLFVAQDLPVPAVFDVGSALGGHYAISERVDGEPLEVSQDWGSLVEPVAGMLEGLRLADFGNASGWGGWDGAGRGGSSSWKNFLLAVGIDSPARRTHGWRAKLSTSATGAATFREGYRLLEAVSDSQVPRSVVHADLINRNVHVAGDTIVGVFDWGCSMYGDHLYDLAWLKFWEPWHPQMPVDLVRDALERRWATAGYHLHHGNERMTACYLHIGLDHLAYNAHLEDWEALSKVEATMTELVAAI